jgi:hypothetical protein
MPNSASAKTPQLSLNRRNILNAAAASAIVTAFGTPAFALAEKAANSDARMLGIDPLALIDESLARAFIGSDFDIYSNTSQAKLRLVKVAGNLTRPSKAQEIITQSFAMEFEALSTTGVLTQDTYHVLHAKLGAFDLLLVPHTNTDGKKVLVATFSRLESLLK